MTIDQALAAALKHHESGRVAEAEALYRQILAVAPQHSDALHLLGVLASQDGRGGLAIELILRAIEHAPNAAVYRSNLGEVYRNLGRLDEAIDAYRSALQIDPRFAAAYSNLGNVLRTLGRHDEALQALRRAVELEPAFIEAHYNLGNVLKDLRCYDEAIAAYRRAIEIAPTFSDAFNNLGETLKLCGRHAEAATALRRSMELHPDDPEAHSNLLLLLHYLPAADAGERFREHCRWGARHAAPRIGAISQHRNNPDPGRRLRVGYVSPDFRDHPVAYFFEGLLANHDAAQVEVFCYANLGRGDAFTERLRRGTAHWREIVGMPDEKVAALIREDAIDILVDLAGHTAHNRLLVFARKPAPVQVSWLGYCDTTGLQAMDYRITDAHADPPGMTEHWHTEKLVRLPETFACFRPSDLAPPVSPLPALARGTVTFGSFHTLAKLNEPLLELWATLLGRVPDARLLVVAGGLGEASTVERWRASLASRGVDPARIEFRDRVPFAGYLAAHAEIDVMLDSHPFSGHTVGCHALWMGVPVVTLAGKAHCSRLLSSVLMNLGCPEWIAQTHEEYLGIATALAADRVRLAGIRAGLRAQMEASPLMNAPRFARNVEAACRAMWRTWCAGQS